MNITDVVFGALCLAMIAILIAKLSIFKDCPIGSYSLSVCLSSKVVMIAYSMFHPSMIDFAVLAMLSPFLVRDFRWQ